MCKESPHHLRAAADELVVVFSNILNPDEAMVSSGGSLAGLMKEIHELSPIGIRWVEAHLIALGTVASVEKW